MKCPRCAHESPQGARFCEECATRLAGTCANCGTALSATAKFCHACAHPVASDAGKPSRAPDSYTPKHLADKILTSKAALEGERKQVTVLFADLKGSMELLADRDPEEARKILDPVLERMMEAVHRYEGTVNQVMGDGIMALFGAPVAHEDHAVRACYTALGMQESVKRYAEEIHRTEGVPVQIRVGLNSGEVVVRSVGSDLRMDYTAVGQTSHLAARMEQMAKPESILMTADCLRLAEGYVVARPLGPRVIKGLEGAIDVYELVDVTSVRSRFQAVAARGLTRFVGRENELAQLRQALEQARSGHGQVVAVIGEPGVGKSRLYWEFLHSHRMHGWLVLPSGSASYGKATPYLPVVDLLKTYFRIGQADDRREIREKVIGKLLALDRALERAVPALLSLLDVTVEEPEWRSLDPVQRRQKTIDAVKRLLLRESQVQPIVVVFEDLHWVDAESQGVLDALVESLPAARMLLLGNYRPEYQHGWGHKTYYTQLRLDALAPESAVELLRALLGAEPTLEALKHFLTTRTGGNPFFLEETVRTLIEAGTLTGERGSYRLTRPLQTIQVPVTVQAVLAARIDRLGAEDKRVLQAASVIGKDVPFALLQAIADHPEDELRHSLARLQAAELLYEAQVFPDLEYTFKHALTHEVTYAGVLHERRRNLHARVVAAIDALHADRLVEHAERLAHHALHGEQWMKAVQYGREAGMKCLERSANREAMTYFEQALSALGRLPDTRSRLELAVDLRFDLYYAMQPLNELPRLLEYVREAEAIADGLEDESRLGWACLHVCHLLLLIGGCAEGVDVGQRALAIAESTGDGELQLVALLWLGCGYYALGAHRRAVDLLRRSVAAQDAAGQVERAGARRFLGIRIPVIARAYLSMFLCEVGEFPEAQAIGQDAIRFAEALDHPYSRALSAWMIGTGLSIRGELDRARPLFERGIDMASSWGYGRTVGHNSYLLGYALVTAGDVHEGLSLLERGAAQVEASLGFTWLRGRRLSMLGEGHLLAGHIDQARRLAEEALSFTRGRGERGFEAWALRLVAEIASRSQPSDTATAKAHYQAALELASTLEMRPLVAHCHAGLAMLYRRADKRQQADEHFASSTAMYREMGMTYWLEKAEAQMQELA